MPQYGIERMTSQKSADMKSSIIEHVTSVKIRESQPKWKYAPSMASNVGRVRRKSDMKSSIVEHVTSVKIRKSHPKQKYAPVCHRMCDRSKNKCHEIIYRRARDLREDP